MKNEIDTNLLRLVLLEVENINEPHGRPIKIKGYTNHDVNIAIEQLESGELVEVFEDTILLQDTENSYIDADVPILVQRLTEDGIKFVNAIRTEKELDKIHDIASKRNICDLKGFIKMVLTF